MNAIEQIKKNYETGQAIFLKLFALNDSELKEKLISITEGNHNQILDNNCDCVRTIKNSIPDKIEFHYYDGIRVDWCGVSIIPEHGCEYLVVKFNSYFSL